MATKINPILGKRIKERREMLDMSQKELSIKVGYNTKYSKSSISKIENQQQDISRTQVSIFAKALNTTEAYLMGWVNNPNWTKEEALAMEYYKNHERPQTIAYDSGSVSDMPETIHTYKDTTINPTAYILSKREKKHIDVYRQLNIDGKSQVDSYTSFIAQTQQYIDSAINPITASIKYFDIPVSAGTGQFVDSDNYIMLDVFETPPSEAEFVVRVCGDSMEPTYSDGDKLYIKPQESVEIGEIGIFSINGDVFVKERGKDGLISHNGAYDKIVFNEGDTITCFGKVVGKCENYR